MTHFRLTETTQDLATQLHDAGAIHLVRIDAMPERLLERRDAIFPIVRSTACLAPPDRMRISEIAIFAMPGASDVHVVLLMAQVHDSCFIHFCSPFVRYRNDPVQEENAVGI
jgi:hypothetical protein